MGRDRRDMRTKCTMEPGLAPRIKNGISGKTVHILIVCGLANNIIPMLIFYS